MINVSITITLYDVTGLPSFTKVQSEIMDNGSGVMVHAELLLQLKKKKEKKTGLGLGGSVAQVMLIIDCDY